MFGRGFESLRVHKIKIAHESWAIFILVGLVVYTRAEGSKRVSNKDNFTLHLYFTSSTERSIVNPSESTQKSHSLSGFFSWQFSVGSPWLGRINYQTRLKYIHMSAQRIFRI
jgi:hypothetical protein